MKLSWSLGAAVFVCVLIPRFAFLIAGSYFLGDSEVYARVAENILDHFCVSLSDPASGACQPHWGGNQLPGYPGFVAATWAIFGTAREVPLVVQSVAMAAAVVYLCRALLMYGVARAGVVVVGLTLAFSPSLIAWSRAFLTEGLAIAIGLWVLAELVHSLHRGRLQVVPLGIALALGFFVRYDAAVLAVPVAFCALFLHSPVQAATRCLVIALIVALPTSVWTIRSVAQGLPWLPPFGLTAQGESLPTGMLRWVDTWIDDQSQLPTSVWVLPTRSYSNFRVAESVYDTPEEARRVEGLLDRLRSFDGAAVPQDIDLEFSEIAAEKRARNPLRHWLVLPARRAVAMWGNPMASLAWPGTLTEGQRSNIRATLETRGAFGLVDIAKKHPWAVISKAFINSYRYAILAAAAALVAASSWKVLRPVRNIILLCAAYGVARTLFFSTTILLETRYLVPALSWLDVGVALGLFYIWQHYSSRTKEAAPVAGAPDAGRT